MSRAFVKDDSDGPEPVFGRPVTDGPNYVTPHGLKRLKSSLSAAEKANDEREIRYYRDRIDSAIVVKPVPNERGVVEFGAQVAAHDRGGKKLQVRIVGEDEAEPAQGSISFDSPIAQAFVGHKVGDRVLVRRPLGPIEYTIDEVTYD